MADHNMDPALLMQLEELREQLAGYLQKNTHNMPQSLELLQKLDRCLFAISSNSISEIEVTQLLSQIAQDFENLPKNSATPSASSLISETIASNQVEQALTRNQGRLAEFLLQNHGFNGDESLALLQEIVLDYAQKYRNHPSEGGSTPAEIQQLLSKQVQKKSSIQSQTHLLQRSDLSLLQELAANNGNLANWSAGKDAVSSSGSLQMDLAAIVGRFDPSKQAHLQLSANNGEMILARVESDSNGNIQRIHIHNLNEAQTKQSSLGTQSGSQSGSPDEVVGGAFASEELRSGLKAQIEDMRQQINQAADTTDEQRVSLEAAQERLRWVEENSLQAKKKLEEFSKNQQQQRIVEELIQATQDAARRTLHQQVESLGGMLFNFASILKQESMASEEARHSLSQEAMKVETLLGRFATLKETPNSTLAQSLSAALNSQITSSLSSVPISAQGRAGLAGLESDSNTLSQQVLETGAAISFAPISAPTVPNMALEIAKVDAAQAIVKQHRQRFQEHFYSTSQFQKILAVTEEPIKTITGISSPRSMRRPQEMNHPSLAPRISNSNLKFSVIKDEASKHLKRLRGLDSFSATPSSNFYSETSGLSVATSAQKALETSGEVTSTVASLFNSTMLKSFSKLGLMNNQAAALANSIGQAMANQGDQRFLGIPSTERYELRPGGRAPLFKRKTSYTKAGRISDLYMPALKMVSGKGEAPKRTEEAPVDELPLNAFQAEVSSLREFQSALLFSLEHLIGEAGTPEEASIIRDMMARGMNTHAALSNLESWTQGKALSKQPRRQKTDDSELDDLVRELKGEAREVPFHVAERLHPVLGVNLSGVKVYTGSRASRIAEEMGANAFTLGKHIFGRIDFATIEGMSLFAHEAVHTGHFDAAGSVSQKEEEAEAMEQKVIEVLSEGKMDFALERPSTPAPSKGSNEVLRSSGIRQITDSLGPGPAKIDIRSDRLVQQLGKVIYRRMMKELEEENMRYGI